MESKNSRRRKVDPFRWVCDLAWQEARFTRCEPIEHPRYSFAVTYEDDGGWSWEVLTTFDIIPVLEDLQMFANNSINAAGTMDYFSALAEADGA